jgi:hypothetical protein
MGDPRKTGPHFRPGPISSGLAERIENVRFFVITETAFSRRGFMLTAFPHRVANTMRRVSIKTKLPLLQSHDLN